WHSNRSACTLRREQIRLKRGRPRPWDCVGRFAAHLREVFPRARRIGRRKWTRIDHCKRICRSSRRNDHRSQSSGRRGNFHTGASAGGKAPSRRTRLMSWLRLSERTKERLAGLATLIVLVPMAVLGQQAWMFLHAVWTDHWIRKDAKPLTAVVTQVGPKRS